MENSFRTTAIVLAVIAITCIPAVGQVELQKAEARTTSIGSSFYADSQSGNQDTVREYDGRTFNLWGVDSLNSYGYSGILQYWLEARDLLVGDEDVSLELGLRNELSLSVKSSSLRHGLVRIPGVDPYLSPLGLTGGTFIDLTPDGSLGIDRRVNEAGVRLTPNGGRTVVRANWRQESEKGLMQFNYRGGTPTQMENVDFGIDRTTDQGSLGTDLRIGSDTAVNYSLESNHFADGGRPEISADRPGEVVIPGIKTTSNLIRARSRLSDRLYFAGVHITRKRTNETAALAEDKDIDVNSTSAAITYIASDTIALSGRYRNYKLDNHMSPVLGDPGDPADNVALNRRERSFQLESNFTGIRKALLRVGYEHKKAERELPNGYPDDPDLSAMMESATTSDIWRTSVSYHPTWRLSFTGKLENWNVDGAEFKASPGDRTRVHFNSTYLISDRFALYTDYSKFHDKRRDSSGLDNKSTDAVLGAWYGITNKITLNALYSKARIDATTFWEQAPHLLDPISSQDVPYDARNKQFSIGLNCAVTPKTSAYLRFLGSDSSGRIELGGLVPGSPALPEGWTPIEVEESRWTIGFTRDLTARDRLLLEYSLADWTDKIDPANDGRFSLWRIAWSTGF